MVEMKTFKNTIYGHSMEYGTVKSWLVGGEVFPTELWDMKVTFTRKVPDPQQGDQVLIGLDDHTYFVRGVHDRKIWLARAGCPETQGFIVNKSDITQITSRG